jgi:hypothetical protein
MEDGGIFYRHLVHFTVFCYILWTFGIVCVNLVYFFPFWYLEPRKIWQPWFQKQCPLYVPMYLEWTSRPPTYQKIPGSNPAMV